MSDIKCTCEARMAGECMCGAWREPIGPSTADILSVVADHRDAAEAELLRAQSKIEQLKRERGEHIAWSQEAIGEAVKQLTAMTAERDALKEQVQQLVAGQLALGQALDAERLKCETLKREFHDVLQPENAALKAALREACDFAMCYCLCADTDGTAGSDIDRIAALRKLVEP